MSDLALFTASELARLIQSKQLSPVELTTHYLNRIDQFDSALNTYITPLPELALHQAVTAENEIMQGNYKGPLHGIPVGIKDNYFTKGVRTTAGSSLLASFTPNENATAVNKLLAAGCIMLGKQNMHEFGAGLTGTNLSFGIARNPWNPEYSPGGSSSGASASVAAGLTALATGSDTFGSIRLPASMCGIYGLKPTYGRISTDGIIPAAWSLDTAGPMARSVADVALMFSYMAGFDVADPVRFASPDVDYSKNLHTGINGIKIGIPAYYLEDLDGDVEKLFYQALDSLSYLGAELIEIVIPELELTTFAGYVTVTGEASAFHYDSLQTAADQYDPDVRSLLLAGALTNTPAYLKAQQARRTMLRAFKQAFSEVDLLLGPTIPITVPKFSTDWIEQNLHVIKRSLPFTAPVNLTGVPALAVPMGLDRNGLPAGMQLIGNHFSEELLLQAGSAWEMTNPLLVRMRK